MTAFNVSNKVVVTTDIAGTGIKKDWEGRVIHVQNGARGLGRSTDLSAVAFQVRFKGGAEIWMTAGELALREASPDAAENGEPPVAMRQQRPNEHSPVRGGSLTTAFSGKP